MSRLFGPIFQNAYMVEDLERAMEHWSGKLGVGPFYLFPLPITFDHIEYRGKPAEGHDLVAACGLAYWGDIQIELIQPGTMPSPYHEFLAQQRPGLQHLGALAHNFDAEMEAARGLGLNVAMQGALPGLRFAYLETDVGYPGAMLELIEQGPEAREMFAMIKRASIGWDGKDPVRNV